MNETPLEAPLYDVLRQFADEKPLRMHMPGHKGIGLPVPELRGYAALDFTETDRTGDLYRADGLIDRAEQLWADYWGSERCLFLTGGSTQGLHTALSLAAAAGSTVIMDRVSHRCLHTGMALLDLRPVWLERPWLTEGGVWGPVSPESVARLLDETGSRTVCITSPTYYGVCSDVEAIAKVCHDRGARLVVDGAHGAHLPIFYQKNPYASADLVTVSAHKTLPAPGQSALLFANGFSMDELREHSLLFATSSPSYPMMAALDRLRTWLACGGEERTFLTAGASLQLREKYPCLREREGLTLDPLRLTLLTGDGDGLNRSLEELGVYPEMHDQNHVVFILTGADGDEQLDRLDAVLTLLGLSYQEPVIPEPFLPPAAEAVCTPREAVFGPQERISLTQAEGRVAAGQIAPYPPGVPVVAPGERITKNHLVYLTQIGYNGLQEDIAVLREPM
ncbi:MAG: aminotransferase class V-fold PLP-dependent enzyme [Clostridiales bacterium]|nr:aminotransferase class V-fold PLP-dependent enzyme [Clostridiales bacterium]